MDSLAFLQDFVIAARAPLIAASYAGGRREMTLHVRSRHARSLDMEGLRRAERSGAGGPRVVLRVHAEAAAPRREDWNAFFASAREDEVALSDPEGWLNRARITRSAAQGMREALPTIVAETAFHAAGQTLWARLSRGLSTRHFTPLVKAAAYFAVGEAGWPHLDIRVCEDQAPAGALRLV